ncbi:MAG: autotransporter domain-containing protein, partial [Selenomonas massiliensis]
MKRHHTHKSKSLAPRILAALAAGAFTLGGMPHGFAAPPDVMSTVTTDTLANDGVAGSTDGTAATITVGTGGGGASPEIYYLASGVHRPTLVAGAWRKVIATDGTIDFTGTNAGSHAHINSGTIGSAIGTYAWLEHGGIAKISEAEVAIKN